MPRRNHQRGGKQQRRVPPGSTIPRRLRPTDPSPRAEGSLGNMILPAGRCYFRSKKGKLIFKTEADANTALRQAKAKRSKQTNGHVECRFYPCPDGGCGGFHLTSRQEYSDRSTMPT